MNNQVQSFKEAIVKNGFRLTAARAAIIGSLVTCAGHITADELALQVKRAAPQIGRMTVYRTLDLLTELGLIRPIYQGTGAAHYILMTEGSHHHLICNQCHTVIEFDNCMADQLEDELARQFNFKVLGHLLEFHGVCANCQAGVIDSSPQPS